MTPPPKSLEAEIILDPLKSYISCIIGVVSSVINSPVTYTLFYLFITMGSSNFTSEILKYAVIILDPLKSYISCIIGVVQSVINSPVICTLFYLFIRS